MKTLTASFCLCLLLACSKSETPLPAPAAMYFPPVGGNSWETTTPASLGWNESNIPALRTYLSQKNTKSFMVLVNGRIVMEEYFNGHTPTATWQWNSAGKTLTSSLTGIAQQDGLLTINDKVNKHLGNGWTIEPLEKENLIIVRHLLTMTSGINDGSELVIKSNLSYIADAGTRWSYHNVFQKLMDVIAVASKQTFDDYFTTRLKNKIGMDGFWNAGPIFTIYNSNTRSMARFGLLALNKGRWENEQVVPEGFLNEAVSSSQTINPSYGYLWWLNGKASYMIPGEQTVYPGTLIPNAPADMFAAMGASDQRLYVIPSKKMIVIRMGNASNPSDPNFAVSGFDNEFWGKLNTVIK